VVSTSKNVQLGWRGTGYDDQPPQDPLDEIVVTAESLRPGPGSTNYGDGPGNNGVRAHDPGLAGYAYFVQQNPNAFNTRGIYSDLGDLMGIDSFDVRTTVQALSDAILVTASRATSGDTNFAALGASPNFTRYQGAMKTIEGAVPLVTLGLGGGPAVLAGSRLFGAGELFGGLNAARGTVGLAERAAQIHGALDPIAQGMRTTAVLETNAGRIIAGGARDLTPLQRALVSPGEIAAQAPGVHAELTALGQAAKMGASPLEMAVTRAICPSCAAAIEASGGVLTSPTTVVW
jgi:Cytidine and deoxycytidylate deaminase zinc-binding region